MIESTKTTTGVIYCAGRDGLGNRLLTLEKACRYAQEFGFSIAVDWSDDVMMLDDSQVHSLLEFNGISVVQDVDCSSFRRPYPNNLDWFNAQVIAKTVRPSRQFRGILGWLQIWNQYSRYKRCYRHVKTGLHAFRNGEQLGLLALQHDLLLYHCSIPEKEPERLRHVRFSEKTKMAVQEACTNLNQAPDIGIHIRNTDKSSENLRWAYSALDRAIREFDGRPVVHLATDSKSVSLEVTQQFQDKATIQSLTMNRGERPIHLQPGSKQDKWEVALQAITDMVILSNAKMFIFQQASSFSRVALALSSPAQRCLAWDHLNDD